MSEKKHKTGRHGLIAALDIGSSKITCFIAQAARDAEAYGLPLRILGVSHHVSRGVRSGVVVDMEAAEETIRAAVESAERMAHVTVEDVVVSVSAGSPTSERSSVEIALSGHEVTDGDVRRVDQLGRVKCMPSERQLLHAIPLTYSIDGSAGVRDPRGMCGQTLGVTMHVVTAAPAPLRNLQVCVERCHLRVVESVLAPYASALAALVEDEMDLGATCIDMGAGTTSFSIFHHGRLVATDIAPLGGAHVTDDIAQGLVTARAHAERLKTLYGSALAGPSDEREMIAVPQMGEEDSGEPNRMPRSMLTSIIRPRLEETFEIMRDLIQKSGCEKYGGRRVVLTGGASQMNGVRELAARILERHVRVSAPPPLPGLPPAASGPAFAAAAGLLLYAQRAPREAKRHAGDADGRGIFQFARIGRWLNENF